MSARVRLFAMAALLLGACRARTAPPLTVPTSARAVSDTLRGIVERVGNEPQSMLVARSAAGKTCVLHFTSPAPALEGLEVALWGPGIDIQPASSPAYSCTYEVRQFAVRAVDGIAAVDGVLRAEGASYALELASGERRALREVPDALRTHVGARIFWAGSLDRAPAAYGVLSAAK